MLRWNLHNTHIHLLRVSDALQEHPCVPYRLSCNCALAHVGLSVGSSGEWSECKLAYVCRDINGANTMWHYQCDTSVMQLSDLVMGHQQMNPLTQHVSHGTTSGKPTQYKLLTKEDNNRTTCLPCPGPANMKHIAVCFSVQGHATDTTIHAQYCRLDYNFQ